MNKIKTKAKEKKADRKMLHKDLYIESFKGINKHVLMTVLLDFGYLITICIGLFCFFLVLNAVLTPAAYAMQSILGLFSTLPSSGEMSTIAEKTLEQNFLTLQWFYIKGLILAITTVLLLFFVTSIYKAHIWMHISNRKHTPHYIFKFTMASMIWQISWLIAGIIIFAVFTPTFVASFLLIELLLYLYFTPFIRMRFTEKHSLIEIYKEAIVMAIKNFTSFIIPLILMVITSVFSFLLYLILTGLVPVFIIAAPFLLLMIIVWIRFYFAVVAKKVVV